MGLDLWFRDDVRRMIASKAQTAGRLAAGEYQRGYLDALDDLAVGFGLSGVGRPAPALGPGQVEAVPWPVGREVTIYQDNER